MIRQPQYSSTFNADQSETVAYNHPLFPVYVRSGLLSSYPGYAAVSHWHDDVEFLVTTKGNITYNVNGQLVEIQAGDGIFVNSRQLHYGFSPDHQECAFICILLSPTLLKGNAWFYETCMARITRNSAVPYLYLHASGAGQDIIAWLQRIYAHYDPADLASCYEALEAFLAICGSIYRMLPEIPRERLQESESLSCVRDMISYIDGQYMQSLSLADIAAAGRCSKSKCAALFKDYVHDTPIIHLTKVRLRKSLAALIETDQPITQIAYDNGFNGASYYCETFRKYYSISPTQYRKEYHA